MLIFIPGIINAQEAYLIDLGKNQNDIIKNTINYSEDIEIIISNKLISAGISYNITITREFQMNEILEIPAHKEGEIVNIKTIGCSVLNNNIENIKEATREEKVAEYVKELETDLQKAQQTDPNEEFKSCQYEQIQLAKKIIGDTRESRKINQLKPNEQIIITISRVEDGKKKEWKHILQTQKKGKWLTTYGFTYVANVLKKGEPYFAKQSDTAFSITPLEQRSRLSFIPSVFFTWFPYKDINRSWSPSVTAGVGYDLEAPTAFLGGSFLYHQNIAISIGFAAHQQDFLNGRYNSGDIINDNLTEAQLNEQRYVINPYISINFRLGTSPFKGPKQETDTEE
ncbi:hypothetical protein [Maribacter sp. MAR_2009_72]|uniref:hypothetical protein n=1 Tax=Maribacter sp. MAR_2009_72 TaxID=1250050 RepID=UPI0011A63862|nr:hypothetical protein [Maribacter sp. MAR_2009_72]